MLEAVIAAHPNTLYVVAAGNDSADADTDGDAFPCALTEANVVCVGATDNRDQIARFSNYGAHRRRPVRAGRRDLLDLPRVRDLLRLHGRHVDGLAARRRRRRAGLVRQPRRLDRVPAPALLRSVDARPGLAGQSVTGGRLNANQAVDAILGAEPAADRDADAQPRPVEHAGARAPAARPGRHAGSGTTSRRARADARSRSAARCAPRRAGCASRSGSRAPRRCASRSSAAARSALAGWSERGRAGANAVTLTRRLPTGRTLKPGAYTLTRRGRRDGRQLERHPRLIADSFTNFS